MRKRKKTANKGGSRTGPIRNEIPGDASVLATVQGPAKNYRLWLANPNHPSLRYRRLEGRENLVTVRIGDHYRALGLVEPGVVVWIWIGPHSEYTRLIRA